MASDEDLPYRADVTSLLAGVESKQVTSDEVNYNTLKAVKKVLAEALNDLNKNFNAFSINKEDLPSDRARKLLHQVEVNQDVYDIVAPLYDSVVAAIDIVDNKFREN